MPKLKRTAATCAEANIASNAAEDRFDALAPDATDSEIADAITEWLLATNYFPPYKFSVTWERDAGPCPVEYTRQHKNTVGIDARDDKERARSWIMRATLANLCVYSDVSQCGLGSIESVRERIRKRMADGRRGIHERHRESLAPAPALKPWE